MKLTKNIGFKIPTSTITGCDLTMDFWSENDLEYLILDVNEFKDYFLFLNKILSQEPNSNLKNKVYLGKLSDLPRHKIKEYFLNNNIHHV